MEWVSLVVCPVAGGVEPLQPVARPDVGTVLIAVPSVVGLARVPVGVGEGGEGVLPDPLALGGGVGGAQPDVLVRGHEAEKGSLENEKIGCTSVAAAAAAAAVLLVLVVATAAITYHHICCLFCCCCYCCCWLLCSIQYLFVL